MSYNPDLVADKDWVRFKIGDRGNTAQDPESFTLSDQEIEAILTEKANKWLAAADCGDVIVGLGQGAVSKSVGNLSISFGDSPESGYRAHLQRLREEGARLLYKGSGSHAFRLL